MNDDDLIAGETVPIIRHKARGYAPFPADRAETAVGCFLVLVVLVLSLFAFSACGPRLSRVWPVSPDVARSSSFDLLVTHADHSTDHGTAWIVDHYHLITAASRCDANGTHAIAVSHPVRAVVIGRSLCLLSSETDLGYPLIIADVTPHGWRQSMHVVGYESAIGAAVVAKWNDQDPWGDPLTVKSGVIGLQLEHGYVGLRGLKGFLNRHHVDWHDEPTMQEAASFAREQGVGADECGGPADLCGP